MAFIETADGLVNASHISRISYSALGDRLFHDATGRMIGKQRGTEPMQEIAAPVIAAAPGAHCLVIWDAREGAEATTIETLRLEYPIILAWRILDDGPQPITADGGIATGELAFFPDHDGRWRLPDWGIYDNLDEAKQAAVRIFSERRIR